MEVIKKQELAVQSQKNGLSQVQQAVQATTFKKLGQCSDNEILTVMRYAMVLCGMTEKDDLNQLETEVIIEFIRGEYANRFTSEDFRLAFRWAMSGKTDVDKSFYGKRFSVAYLSNFMEAYEVKKKEMLELEKRNKKPVLELMEDSRDKETKDRDTYLIFEKYVIENRKLPPILDVNPCFSHLKREGKLDFSEAKIALMKEKAKAAMLNEIEMLKYKLHDYFKAKSATEKLNDESEMRYQTKRKYVEDYLLSLMGEDIKTEDL